MATGACEVGSFEERVEAFVVSHERAEYEALAGLRDDPDMASIYELYEDLFDPAAFRSIEPPAGPSPEDRRRAHLREFVAEGIEGHRVRDLTDRALALEASRTVEVEGQSLPYRRLPVEIRHAVDRGPRAALDAARRKVVDEELNPLYRASLERRHAVASELLEASYDRYCATLSGIDYDALERETSTLLESTADLHRELLADYVREELDGVRAGDLEGHDLVRLIHGARFDRHFPSRATIDRVRRALGSAGIDLEADGRIELDLEDRPTKSPRAFCSPIRAPEEVKLVLQPQGGFDDAFAFLHELGHALHFAHVDPELPFVLRTLGDFGVTEGYAIGFDHLLLSRPFLTQVGEVEDPEPLLRFGAFRDVVYLRRYAAKFAYERSLHRRGDGPGRPDEYVERLTAATGARAAPELYLDDVDPRFYVTRYLRAWMFAGGLHHALRERFDEDWFANPRTGPFLIELWALGQAEPVEALAQRIGFERLSFEPLLGLIGELVD